MRVNVNINEDLLTKIDAAARKLHVSRSAYISLAVSDKLRQEEVLSSFPEMLKQVAVLNSMISAADTSFNDDK